MYCKAPVIAVNSGGPTESIDHGVTGYLCNPDGESFGKAIGKVVEGEGREEMGRRGRERVVELFSLGTFERELGGVVDGLVKDGGGKKGWWAFLVGVVCCFGFLLFRF